MLPATQRWSVAACSHAEETGQLPGDIAPAKMDLLKWLVPIPVGQAIAIAGLVKLLRQIAQYGVNSSAG